MTKQKIIEEGNKLIAEFMGFELSNLKDNFHDIYYRLPDVYRLFMHCSHWHSLEFNSNWQWLMPVVEKCYVVSKQKQVEFKENKGLDLNDSKGWRSWSYRDIHLSTNIDNVWLETVRFIKWYNK
jgi:hypothetical protein